MLRTKALFAIFAAVIIGAAAYAYIGYGTSEGITDWSQGNIGNIDGKWKVNIKLTFDDGTSEFYNDIKEDSALTVLYGGSEVTKVTWYLEALAETPSNADAWDSVDLDLGVDATLSLKTEIIQGANTYWSNTDNFPVYDSTYHMMDIDTGIWVGVCSHEVNLETATDGISSGLYSIKFTPSGTIFYRGVDYPGDEYNPGEDPIKTGDWVEGDLPAAAEFAITLEQEAVSVQFRDNIWCS